MLKLNTRPELRGVIIEAVKAYCEQYYFRPYIWIDVDEACIVPTQYVTEGMIILDVDSEAVRNWNINGKILSFEARFDDDEEPMKITVPLNRIVHVAPAEAPDTGASFMSSPTSDTLYAEITGRKRRRASPPLQKPMRIK